MQMTVRTESESNFIDSERHPNYPSEASLAELLAVNKVVL